MTEHTFTFFPNNISCYFLLHEGYIDSHCYLVMILYFASLLLDDIPGAAEEAAAVFGEASLLCIQKQHIDQGNQSQNLQASTDDQNVASKNIVSDDISPRQSKHTHSNNLREISGNYNGAAAIQNLGGVSTNMSFYNTPSPMASQVI